MKKSVYVETSIFSYLVGRPSRDLLIAACQQATIDWWQNQRRKYDLYVSQLVTAEAAEGDTEAATKRMACIEGIKELPLTNEAILLAEEFVSQGVLPAKAEADSIHIAVAAVHEMDLLLTWNCRHINNPEMKPLIRSVCIMASFSCPEICTPIEILEAADEK